MSQMVRVVTYNIHKGVRGLGPGRSLEIHNLGHAISRFGADLVCLQEVRKLHRGEEKFFAHWPAVPGAAGATTNGKAGVLMATGIKGNCTGVG